jgi:hypothetical protein
MAEEVDTPVQEQPPKKLSVDEFAAQIKAKYPDYAKVDNATLTKSIIEKYPDYANKVNLSTPYSISKFDPNAPVASDTRHHQQQDAQLNASYQQAQNKPQPIPQASAPKVTQKNSWNNIGDFSFKTVQAGLEKDLGGAMKFVGDNFAFSDKNPLSRAGENLRQAGISDEQTAQSHSLPNTTMGKVASSAIGFAPDIMELALTPELDVAKIGKLGDVLAKYGGKYAPKVANMAAGKFPIQQATKGLTGAYADNKAAGMDDTDALAGALKTGVEDYGKGVLFEGAGKAAEKATDFGKKLLEDNGLMSGNKLVAGAEKKILHSTAQATAFSAVPFVTNAVQGKPTSLDELKNNAIFGGVLGMVHSGEAKSDEPTPADGAAKEVLQRAPLVDLHNFMDTDVNTIKAINDTKETPHDLQIKAATHAEDAFKSDDQEEKQQQVVQSSVNGKASSVKAVTQSILKDKDGVVEAVNDLPLPQETKDAVIAKVDEVHKALDPIEQQKTKLADEITELQQEPTGDIIKDKENKIKLQDKNAQLDDIIKKQYEQTKQNTEVPAEQPADETVGVPKVADQNDETTKNNSITKTQEDGKNDEMGKQPSRQEGGQSRNEENGGSGEKISTTQEKEVVKSGEDKTKPDTIDPIRQKAIDAITHGIVGDPERKPNDTSPRFDLGMSTKDQEVAVRHITEGKYDGVSAKRLIDKVVEFEKKGEYPIIEGQGGQTNRSKFATSEDIQQNIDDAKSFKLAKEQDIEANNKGLKDLGITHQDVQDYENYRNAGEPGTIHGRAVENPADNVQRPENDQTASKPQGKGGEAVQSSLSSDKVARLNELRKKFGGQLNDITRIPTLLADKEFREYAGLVLEDTLGDFKAFSKRMIDEVGEKIKEHLPGLFKELGGKEEEGGEEVKKTILTKRAYEGDVADDVKKYLEDKGLTRKSFSQEERSKQATDFIDKFGEDAAFRAVESGDIDGGMAASILAQLQIKNSRAMTEFPEGSEERDILAKKQADYIALMEKKGYLGGEFNGQLAHEYENAELDFAEVKKRVEALTGKPLTPEQGKKIKALTDENENLKAKLKDAEAKLIEATDKEFKADTADKNETKTEKAKRVADKLRANAKIHRPGVFSAATPASVAWDAAIEIAAKSIEAGGKVADAIDKGIEHIKSTDWYKSLSKNKKELAEKEFTRFNHDSISSTDLDDLRDRFVNKTDNKFSHTEARDIWGYMKNRYIENGISYRDALSKTADDLGLSWRQVSEAITTPKNKRMSDEMWKRQAENTRYRTAIKNWIGDQNKSILGKALQKVSGAFRGVSVFGHGGIFMGTHAGMTLFNPSTLHISIPAFFRGWKFAYGNEGAYQRSMEELKNSPNYVIAQRAGLKNNPERLNAEEYQKSQKYLGKLGLAGERGFNAIKVLRQGLFDYHFNKLSAAERDDPEVAKSIAHIANLATGATTIKIPAWVNEASFAGGMEAARWEKLTSSPVKATQTALNAIFHPSKATVADRVFAKVWARRVGEQLATYTGAMLVNSAIQNTINPKNPVNITNPNKPDFLKFKFGDVTIDPTSGMRATAMFMHALGKIPFEEKKELHGDKRIKVAGKDVAGYARGKLAPLYSTAADFFEGQDYNSNVMPYSHEKPNSYAHKLTWGEYAWQKAPLPIAEAANVAYQSALEHGAHKVTLDHVLNGIMSGAISGTTGVRVGEYDANSPKNKKH